MPWSVSLDHRGFHIGDGYHRQDDQGGPYGKAAHREHYEDGTPGQFHSALLAWIALGRERRALRGGAGLTDYRGQ